MDVPPPPPAKPVEEDHAGDSSMDEDEVLVVARRHGMESDEPSDAEEEEGDEEESEEEPADEESEEEESEDDTRGRRTLQLKPGARGQRGPPGDPTIIPWAREIGVDPQKMHVMQTSLFRMPEEERALKALNQPQSRRKLLLTSNLSRKHSRDSEGDGLRADSRQVCRASLA